MHISAIQLEISPIQLKISPNQSQIQDFPKEGARFRVKCHVDAIQWGGGSSRIFFRDLQNPMRFSGGGVVAQKFSLALPKYVIFRWWGPFGFFYFPEGGARAPWPPLNRPLQINWRYLQLTRFEVIKIEVHISAIRSK